MDCNKQRKLYLHHFPLAAATKNINLSLNEEFAVAAGLTPAGGYLFPHAKEVDYIVAGGPTCAAHCGRLGIEGQSVEFKFQAEVDALVVATYNHIHPSVSSVAIAQRNLAPESIRLSGAVPHGQVRVKYSDDYSETCNYTQISTTWNYVDGSGQVTPGPDAPAEMWIVTSKDNGDVQAAAAVQTYLGMTRAVTLQVPNLHETDRFSTF